MIGARVGQRDGGDVTQSPGDADCGFQLGPGLQPGPSGAREQELKQRQAGKYESKGGQ